MNRIMDLPLPHSSMLRQRYGYGANFAGATYSGIYVRSREAVKIRPQGVRKRVSTFEEIDMGEKLHEDELRHKASLLIRIGWVCFKVGLWLCLAAAVLSILLFASMASAFDYDQEWLKESLAWRFADCSLIGWPTPCGDAHRDRLAILDNVLRPCVTEIALSEQAQKYWAARKGTLNDTDNNPYKQVYLLMMMQARVVEEALDEGASLIAGQPDEFKQHAYQVMFDSCLQGMR